MANILHVGELDGCAWSFPIFLRGDDLARGDVVRVRLQRSLPCGHGVCAVATALVLVI